MAGGLWSLAPSMVPVFVISLPNSNRRPEITRHLNEHNIPFEFWNGHLVEDRSSSQYGQSTLNSGTLGCLIAYLDLYRHIALKKIPLALILEDDVICNPQVDFGRLEFSKIFEMTQSDYCFLHCYPCGPCGTQGQLVSLKAAELLDAERSAILATDAPIDLILWEQRTASLSELRVEDLYKRLDLWLFKHAHQYDDANNSERMQLNWLHQKTVMDHK